MTAAKIDRRGTGRSRHAFVPDPAEELGEVRFDDWFDTPIFETEPDERLEELTTARARPLRLAARALVRLDATKSRRRIPEQPQPVDDGAFADLARLVDAGDWDDADYRAGTGERPGTGDREDAGGPGTTFDAVEADDRTAVARPATRAARRSAPGAAGEGRARRARPLRAGDRSAPVENRVDPPASAVTQEVPAVVLPARAARISRTTATKTTATRPTAPRTTATSPARGGAVAESSPAATGTSPKTTATRKSTATRKGSAATTGAAPRTRRAPRAEAVTEHPDVPEGVPAGTAPSSPADGATAPAAGDDPMATRRPGLRARAAQALDAWAVRELQAQARLEQVLVPRRWRS